MLNKSRLNQRGESPQETPFSTSNFHFCFCFTVNFCVCAEYQHSACRPSSLSIYQYILTSMIIIIIIVIKINIIILINHQCEKGERSKLPVFTNLRITLNSKFKIKISPVRTISSSPNDTLAHPPAQSSSSSSYII